MREAQGDTEPLRLGGSPAARDGADELHELLRRAVETHPATAEGAALRRAAARGFQRRARTLVRAARTATASSAADLVEEANKSLVMGLVAARAPFRGRPDADPGVGTQISVDAAGTPPEPVTPSEPVKKPELSPRLPAFSSDPALVFDAAENDSMLRYGRLLQKANDIGGKWRYEHLSTLAKTAAEDAIRYDELIAQLMGMTVMKAGVAQTMLSPVLQAVLSTLQADKQAIQSYASDARIAKIADDIGRAAAAWLLFQAIVDWLLAYEPIEFWVGLFDAVVKDLAQLNTGLTVTNAYLASEFRSGPLGAAIRDRAARLAREGSDRVDAMIAPLRVAVDRVVAGTSDALRELFESFDLPLLMQRSGVANHPNVPNVDPLATVTGNLDAAVNGLQSAVEARLTKALSDAAQGAADLFVPIMISYVVTPILAAVLVAVAAGPLGAAALAGVVLVAAPQLLRLLASWLKDPITSKVRELEADVTEKFDELRRVLGSLVTSGARAEDSLTLLASELRELSDLLPRQFLEDAASIIAAAREAALDDATALALAAERALGAETASAFDVIDADYARRITTPAPQLPGGVDTSMCAGATLRADLARLDRARTELRDPKEMEVTYRVSLARHLGDPPPAAGGSPTGAPPPGGGFAEFLRTKRALVHLEESVLADESCPGLYRILIKDVRCFASIASAAPPDVTTAGVPVTVTHLGRSSTRVKRSANSAAPPVTTDLPQVLRQDEEAFAQSVVDGLEAISQETRKAAIDALPDERVESLYDTPPVAVSTALENVFVQRVSRAVSDRITAVGGGYVDGSLAATAAARACASVNWGSVGGYTRASSGYMSGGIPGKSVPVRTSTWIRPSDAALSDKIGSLGVASTVSAAVASAARTSFRSAAWSAGVGFGPGIGKWGAAWLTEDADPHVRALGFVRLVRDLPTESMVVNLFPDEGRLPTGVAPPAGGFVGSPPVTALDSLQQRPFENRGLDGVFIVSLGPGELSNRLTDVTLEITCRACFDSNLAATVRASGSQTAARNAAADSIATRKGFVSKRRSELPGPSSPIETVHLSLRAHRDFLLSSAVAALPADRGLEDPVQLADQTVDGLTFAPATTPLRAQAAYSPLGRVAAASTAKSGRTPTLDGVKLTLTTSSARTTLGDLLDQIVVTPADLGIDPLVADGELVALGVAIIPAKQGLTVARVTVPPVLSTLLPRLTTDTRFAITTTAAPIPLKEVWNAQGTSVDLEFAPGSIAEGNLYDVIFSLSYRAGTPTATGTPA